MTPNEITAEPIIEPELPIVDAHHHLWFLPEPVLAEMDKDVSISGHLLTPIFRRYARYLFDEYMRDVATGHDVRASVYVDAHAMYRRSGPDSLRSLGEVEFVTGVAAMADSGLFGDVRVCAAIVGGVDLRIGDAVEDVLTAHITSAGGRYRGVRSPVVSDEDSSVLGDGVGSPHVLLDATFRKGFSRLNKFDLSFDAWVFDPQLPELIDLARAFPETSIILDHVGTPLGVGRYAGSLEARFPLWRKHIQTLASCQNVTIKLGGLGIPFVGITPYITRPSATSEQLADEWKPYIHTCIEAFGADRCMFESNFPVDAAVCSYPVLWNTFKRLATGASRAEKMELFGGTARRVYRLHV